MVDELVVLLPVKLVVEVVGATSPVELVEERIEDSDASAEAASCVRRECCMLSPVDDSDKDDGDGR